MWSAELWLASLFTFHYSLSERIEQLNIPEYPNLYFFFFVVYNKVTVTKGRVLMKKEHVCLIIAAAVILLSCAAVIIGRIMRCDNHIAYIYSNGELIKTIDLDKVDQPYEFMVGENEAANNTVSVRKGEIGVTGASCPDKICVHHGFIDSNAEPIICMPNKLVITVGAENKAGVDAVAE